MSYSNQLRKLTSEIVDKLSDIEEFPEELFPHLVFIEEVNGRGEPEYVKYRLQSIEPYTGYCTVKFDDGFDNEEERRELAEINLEWLITIWERYQELTGNKFQETEILNSRVEAILNEAFLMPMFFVGAFNVFQGAMQQMSDEEMYELLGNSVHADSLRQTINRISDQLNFRDQHPEIPNPYTPKQYWAFIYPNYEIYRKLSDKELIEKWETQDPTTGQIECMTPEEFNAYTNQPDFSIGNYRVRFL
ncbi:MAG: hypothetical protein LUD15_06290, partial [Bacteroides sp.]|nr:hypothetical protein [Bacteroides sp.]